MWTCLRKWDHFSGLNVFTHKQLETHGCVLSTLAIEALVLIHQAIGIHSAEEILIVLDQFHTEILHLWGPTSENKITFWKKKKKNSGLRVKSQFDLRYSFAEVPAAHKYLIKDIYGSRLTWEEAQLLCIEWGGSLANITSAQEDYFIKNLLNKGQSMKCESATPGPILCFLTENLSDPGKDMPGAPY